MKLNLPVISPFLPICFTVLSKGAWKMHLVARLIGKQLKTYVGMKHLRWGTDECIGRRWAGGKREAKKKLFLFRITLLFGIFPTEQVSYNCLCVKEGNVQQLSGNWHFLNLLLSLLSVWVWFVAGKTFLASASVSQPFPILSRWC